ncbi:hypothetical protein V8B97DRAFT_1865268 [Scleroderma yunnanense]
MPVVTVLPPSLPGRGVGSSYSENSVVYQSDTSGGNHISNPTMQNGSVVPNESLGISEIKEKAKEDARRHAKGISAISLLKAARNQSQIAHANEAGGDLKGALSALLKAGSLAAMVMNSAEFLAESKAGKHGVLYKEFVNFQKYDGNNLKQRVEAIESKLTDLEKSAAAEPIPDAASKRVGTSIADRVRSLNDAGLVGGTATKRLSREVTGTSSSSTTPKSPELVRTHRLSTSILSHPQPLRLPTSIAATASSSAASSPHAVVPASSLGPPSPVSSDSSSPRLSHPSVAEFSQAFPSIDELDELDPLRFPAVPQGSIADTDSLFSRVDDAELIIPPRLKSFPSLSIDPGPRPSSTPITLTMNSLMSRPASPAITSKPSINNFASSSLSSKPSPQGEKPVLPNSNGVTPRQLFDYLHTANLNVLLVDIRTRAEFETEHIKGGAVVCLDPSVLTRVNASVQSIEGSFSVAPVEEFVLFKNREKFDLVVLYDASSEKYDTAGPLSAFNRLLYENAFSKMLRRPPVLLLGGLQAWKEELGGKDVVRGVPGEQRRSPISTGENRLSSTSGPVLSATSTPDSSRLGLPPNQHGTNGVPSSDRISPEKRHPDLPTSPPIVDNAKAFDEPVSINHRIPIPRPPSSAISPNHSPSESSPYVSRVIPQSVFNAPSSSISYPTFSSQNLASSSTSLSFSSSAPFTAVSVPPQASINPSRRRSEYMDGPQSPVSSLTTRPAIDYPDLPLSTLRPPPPAASPSSERQDARPRLMHTPSYSLSTSPPGKMPPKPPTIPSDYPVAYWSDEHINTAGLKNLGNTCYMNATIQCLHATVPFARFFTDGRWKGAVNMLNPLGTKGGLAQAFANILYEMSHSELPHLTPLNFRKSICHHASQFSGSDQHDSQEFLTFLLDGLHEDLNRVITKPPNLESTPEREAELEKLPQQVASAQEWGQYKRRNDSLIVDYFQGQFRNRMECLTCHHTSTTYNSFMYLSLPIASLKSPAKISLQSCLDAFVREEVMEKAEAWHCPKCKQLRKATKKLTLSRLPPILLIHLKRFSVKGPFTDKIETVVDFPLKDLDLTNYMPPPLPPGKQATVNGAASSIADDPRAQTPPYKYDLYGVTNHFGSLSNGHYTAFIASRGGWLYCDDSRITSTNTREVVGRPAYVLYYKRVKQ